MSGAHRTAAFVTALLALGLSVAADARDEPVVHERIPSDPREDLALHVALDGDLPAAIQTPGGIVAAPDPLRPPAPWELTYGPGGSKDPFVPDTDTKRPDVSDYDDPFTPSTAPFKRLEAFDAVMDDYRLKVRDDRLVRLTTQQGAPPSPEEDPFYADLVVEVPPEGVVRIPSVGPGARVVRARLGVGASDLPYRILRDGADNWFLQPTRSPTPGRALAVRARLVMELAVPRAALGGPLGDPSWTDLPFVAPLPDNVARDAAEVRDVIGVSRAMRPREAIAKLVDYFRGFVDSVDPPRGRGSVYLNLSLSRKGVCRHRAFAFLVTAQSLGVPTRLVENEAHAWVEVHDGTLWKRIDLGGAGRMATRTSNRLAARDPYEGPREAFPWPRSSERGDDMIGRTAAAGKTATSSRATPPANAGMDSSAALVEQDRGRDDGDRRPPSTIVLTVTDAVVHRGLPIHVRGNVRADGEPCPHVAVELWLREPKEVQEDEGSRRRFAAGTIATNEDGTFAGTAMPTGLPLGDYDLLAETTGDSRCGRGAN